MWLHSLGLRRAAGLCVTRRVCPRHLYQLQRAQIDRAGNARECTLQYLLVRIRGDA